MEKKIRILCLAFLCILFTFTNGDPGRDLCKIISGGGLKCSKMSSYLFPYDSFLSFNDDLPHFTNEMKYLEIGSSNITVLQSRSFQYTPNLSQLVLSSVYLKEIEPGAFEGLDRLKSVDLSNNLLQTIPVDAFKYTNIDWLKVQGNFLELPTSGPIFHARYLTSLNFRNCNIQQFSEEAFSENPNLIHLDLSQNGLRTLPEKIFTPLQKLTFLDLSRNQFQTMDIKIFESIPTFPKYPMTVLLSENPWLCDCRLSKLSEWATKNLKTEEWSFKPSLCRIRTTVGCKEPNITSWNSPEMKEIMTNC